MARPFFETLRDLRGGMTLEELASGLSELVAAVKATGKGGIMTLQLRIKPPRRGGDYLHVEDEVSVKLPKKDRADTIFFPTADNSLTRTDPRQHKLTLEVVDHETGEVRRVADGR